MRIMGKSILFWIVVAVIVWYAYHWWQGRQTGAGTAAASKGTRAKVSHAASGG
jgi:predicted negative regulator of RcsB-dependent stress response